MTALTLRAVFRLAYRQPKGLIGSIVGLSCASRTTGLSVSALAMATPK